jgi:putative addiction module killer protein
LIERRMMNVRRHPKFEKFLRSIKDAVVRAAVVRRIEQLAAGNPGKTRDVGDGVLEMKIKLGPGWRVYYTRIEEQVVVLLTGGTKNGQQDDIEAAKKLARELKK